MPCAGPLLLGLAELATQRATNDAYSTMMNFAHLECVERPSIVALTPARARIYQRQQPCETGRCF